MPPSCPRVCFPVFIVLLLASSLNYSQSLPMSTTSETESTTDPTSMSPVTHSFDLSSKVPEPTPDLPDQEPQNKTEITDFVAVSCDSFYEQICESETECIPKETVCDGIFDCADKSDETPDLCQHHRVDGSRDTKGRFLHPSLRCWDTWFFCQDASRCIEPASVCDNHDDCDDGSDENANFCRYLNIERILSEADVEEPVVKVDRKTKSKKLKLKNNNNGTVF